MKFPIAVAAAVMVTGTALAAPPNYTRSPAQIAAAKAYDEGDLKTAITLFRVAAEEGDSGAQLMLGAMYQFGKGVPKDSVEARKWLTLAAEQGRGEAMNNLAGLYRDGEGVPANQVTALKWFLLAVEYFPPPQSGLPDYPKDNINKMLATMSSADIAEARRLAAQWKPIYERR